MSPLEPKGTDRVRLIDTMVEACKDADRHVKRLTTWEIDFLESVIPQWEGQRYLSDKQFTALERIYTNKIS